MAKVVLNRCHGGFALSWLATLMLAQKGYEEAITFTSKYGPSDAHFYPYSIERHNEDLVSVVEELGKRANGDMSSLEVEEVEGLYRIVEYDGYESLETPGSIKWKHTSDPQALSWKPDGEST